MTAEEDSRDEKDRAPNTNDTDMSGVTSAEGLPTDGEERVPVSMSPASNRLDHAYDPSMRRLILSTFASQRNMPGVATPFKTEIEIGNPGKTIPLTAIVDDGAMVNVIDTTAWGRWGKKLTRLTSSPLTLHMANNKRISSRGRWTGMVTVEGRTVEQHFEVYETNGSFEILLGKPWLIATNANHTYQDDMITLNLDGTTTSITNKAIVCGSEETVNGKAKQSGMDQGERTEVKSGEDAERVDIRATLPQHPAPPSERTTDPFNPERVAKILNLVEIGPDLSPEQRAAATRLVTNYADIFALTMKEVLPVDFIEHKLRIDESVKLPTKIYHQKPLTDPQREWYARILDEMEAADIIERIGPEQVWCANSTNLAPKDKGDTGMSRAEIYKKIDDECRAKGYEPFWSELDNGEETEDKKGGQGEDKPKKAKWRLCHAFTTLNKATQVPPFPQGNLTMKQQQMAGKRWTSVIDFASSYYAVKMDDQSKYYTAFLVDGRGYYIYK